MNRYLLDTNHLSAYLDRHTSVEQKVDERLRAGDRVGLCLPVLWVATWARRGISWRGTAMEPAGA